MTNISSHVRSSTWSEVLGTIFRVGDPRNSSFRMNDHFVASGIYDCTRGLNVLFNGSNISSIRHEIKFGKVITRKPSTH